MTANFSVGIVGGGLVGALEACLLAKRGLQVTLFEGRHDGRREPSYYGRSINMALSHRGLSALKRLDFAQEVKEWAIPMSARMIHNSNGKLNPIPYDPDRRCINSIERAHLNNLLLDKAEQEFRVRILFNHKLVDMDADKGELMFRVGSNQEEGQQGDDKVELLRYKFNLILGCDGSRSAVRSLMARQAQIEVHQSYIEHGYLELRIDPYENQKSYKMDPNYLHIWPRGQYMMIALPNRDKSFTCTLFMPFNILNKLQQNDDEGLSFFRRNFPDSVELIGEERIKWTLSQVRASSLVSIKCKPYYLKHRVAILGDAAHAMVPFYGQGMNCGFEDCLVLDELLDKYMGSDGVEAFDQENVDEQIGKVLSEYSEIRCSNGQAMCDLAMYNYLEMRDLVNTWSFMLRKKLDNLLYRIFPKSWIPLYTMVTFSRIPVDECISRRRKQDAVLDRCARLGATCLLGGLLVFAGLRFRIQDRLNL